MRTRNSAAEASSTAGPTLSAGGARPKLREDAPDESPGRRRLDRPAHHLAAHVEHRVAEAFPEVERIGGRSRRPEGERDPGSGRRFCSVSSQVIESIRGERRHDDEPVESRERGAARRDAGDEPASPTRAPERGHGEQEEHRLGVERREEEGRRKREERRGAGEARALASPLDEEIARQEQRGAEAREREDDAGRQQGRVQRRGEECARRADTADRSRRCSRARPGRNGTRRRPRCCTSSSPSARAAARGRRRSTGSSSRPAGSSRPRRAAGRRCSTPPRERGWSAPPPAGRR